MSTIRAGVVAAYDLAAGLGVVTDDAGGEYCFHCTAIADGSRDIDTATPVVFRTAPGHLGRIEAIELLPR